MFEYVNRAEYSPVKVEVEKIINRVNSYMQREYDTAFCPCLIGSGKRHLITREVKGNAGYDFDYNLVLPAPEPGYHYVSKVLKEQFMEAFKYAVKGTKYSNPKDSTSAITIKVGDRKNSKVVHSCDFTIIYYEDDIINNGYFYLRNNKKQNSYTFEYRKLSFKIDEKIDYILEYQNGWNKIRDEYLKLKNRNNDKNKKSFSIYLEAVNNIYNQLKMQEDENKPKPINLTNAWFVR